MMGTLLQLYPFLFLFLFLPILNTVLSQPQQLFYSGFNHIPGTNLSLTGIAKIDDKNGILKLTNETSRLIGHAFYPIPFQFKNNNGSRTFSFSSSFAIAIVPEYPKLGGHGLAFTISASMDTLKHALPSQYLGLLNSTNIGNFSNHLFAVEFDTVQDFEFGDINDNHVGININNLVSNVSCNASYYAEGEGEERLENLNLKGGKPIMVWVDYDSVKSVISVTLSPSSTKPKKPTLSYSLDLSPIFHERMYVGFSASTGLLASSHYVLGWSFKINGTAPTLDLDSLPKLPGPKKKQTPMVVGVSVATSFIALFSLFLGFYLFWKIKNADVIEPWELEIGPHRYSYKELKKATKGFKDKGLLGQGGFGRVYKGTLPNSKNQVAVKRVSHESKQGLREFVSEIASIGRLRHRNLVQLLGWCRRRGDLLLVYDFMENGSLDKYLFDEPKTILRWQERFKIIKDVASALLYLHEGYEQVVIHRDVKASNVLLDSEMNGRLGDFGLARLYEHGGHPSTTRVVGTLGYLAPELPRTGKATPSTDVYAFGALMLEVACGVRPVDPRKAQHEDLVLVDWVWKMYKEGKLIDVVDPNLNGDFDEREVVMVLKLGLMCSNGAPTSRPSMRQVTRYLDGENLLPDSLMKPHHNNQEGFDEFLNPFGSSFNSSDNIGMYASFPSFTNSPVFTPIGRRETS
ncbi:L-type lectin-domain containing receptor kinase S.4-like [Arachis stenosperma]|uniref:L-type lectin-domain containing receptor kinase S.4-like n=1 Tax=Arachis stenosperma TaxID=217475 RepID=UPI0025AC0AC8|nr:L-type lectin-domain containing receptor kinase S.4-like [Arachis stenosperma]